MKPLTQKFRQRIIDTLPERINEMIAQIQPEQLDVDFLLTPRAGNCLYIHGPAGSGKTTTAAALLLRCAEAITEGAPHNGWLLLSHDCYKFVSVPDLLRQIKATYQKGYEGISEDDLFQQYAKVPFLVLDDIGAEKTTEWTLQALYVIIDYRYNHLKPTIFTSNLTIDELTAQFGSPRIPSRISGMCRQIEFNNDDMRRKA